MAILMLDGFEAYSRKVLRRVKPRKGQVLPKGIRCSWAGWFARRVELETFERRWNEIQLRALGRLDVVDVPRGFGMTRAGMFRVEHRAEKGRDRCSYCDGTGDVHSIDGEWRGRCSCRAGQEPPQGD